MIPELGLFSLILALLMAICLSILPIIGDLGKKSVIASEARQFSIAKRAAIGQCFFVVLSFGTLVYCFMSNDFSVEYVAQNSNSQLPSLYKFCAVWGAHEGSLLLWSLILTLWTLVVALYSQAIPTRFLSAVLSTLGLINTGFLLLLLFTSNPFLRLLPFSPVEGADLNPLLQDPGFVLHPPILYMGYVGFAIPFAFAVAFMLINDKTIPWAMFARPWALLAWAFLTLGITLGSWWAYYELGWGGWWFWDPVENASFMPWLVGVALGHALFVTSKREQLSTWSLLLALSAFVLSLIGTFLVRSGVLSSVHAFASDPGRGTFILCFMGLAVTCAFGLYTRHLATQKSTSTIHTVSKESFILLGNIVLMVAMLTVLLGTLYPLIIDVFSQEKLSVGPAYFNQVFVPLFCCMLVIMGATPSFQWHQDNLKRFWQQNRKRLTLYLILSMGLLLTLYQRILPLSMLGMLLGSLLIGGMLFELLNRPHWKKWGMILAHLGMGITVLGISLTTSLETEKEFTLAVGETVPVADYTFAFQGTSDIKGMNFEGKQGHFIISHENKIISQLYPEKRYFTARQLVMTETAIQPGFWRDFYIALGEKFDDGSWSVRIYIKPFIRWIWLGGILIALGAMVSSIDAFAALKRRNEVKI